MTDPGAYKRAASGRGISARLGGSRSAALSATPGAADGPTAVDRAAGSRNVAWTDDRASGTVGGMFVAYAAGAVLLSVVAVGFGVLWLFAQWSDTTIGPEGASTDGWVPFAIAGACGAAAGWCADQARRSWDEFRDRRQARRSESG